MSKLYFKQLLAGRDFALNNEDAASMENFVYLIGDSDTKECIVVDAAWNIRDILNIAQKDNMKIVGALATHYHQDHVGGDFYGHKVEGLSLLMQLNPCHVHAHKLEKPGIIKVTHLSESDIIGHESGDVVKVGEVEIKLLHTPGHTPGSLCFCVKNCLISGDTLFLRSCGRVDLPGGSVEDMYKTVTEKLYKLPDDTIIYPGHAYSGEHEKLSVLKKHNPVFNHFSLESFKNFFGKRFGL